MPHLDAKALEDDAEGCAFLRSVLKGDATAAQQPPAMGPALCPNSQFLRQPVFAQRIITAHPGRELRAVYRRSLSSKLAIIRHRSALVRVCGEG